MRCLFLVGILAAMSWFAIFFFLSGLCSIVYELVWLRLAMAKFGVTTALVSIVLSVFMAGLGAGSWMAGRATRRYGERIKFPALRLYGVIELLIGMSALIVPLELTWGSHLLEHTAGQASISSGIFYLDVGSVAGAYVDSLVRVHGRHHPGGDVRHPPQPASRRTALFQFPLSRQRDWSCCRRLHRSRAG